MTEVLETTVDKFIFRVPTDRRYTEAGTWALPDGDRVRVGISDFVQQRSGDVAFVEVHPEGAPLAAGDELAVIETIKANLEVLSPIAGTIAVVNPALARSPEVVNLDPYGEGWLAVVAPASTAVGLSALLDAPTYLERMRRQAETEVGEP